MIIWSSRFPWLSCWPGWKYCIDARSAPSVDTQTTLQVADLSMDLLKQHVQRQGTAISLQPREYKLLEYMMRHAGQVVTRAMLLEHVWGYHFDPQTNVIDVHVSRLRQKIDRDFGAPLLAHGTRRGLPSGAAIDD